MPAEHDDGHPVLFCADLSPASLLAATARGRVPFPAGSDYLRDLNEFRYEDLVADGAIAVSGADPYRVAWWEPDPRPVLPADGVHLGRNTRKALRRAALRTTANAAFEQVAEACRAGREPRWLTGTLLDSLTSLHADGWAHSVEVWDGDELIAGAFGIGMGAVISGDSMFSRREGAARIAVADMADRLLRAGGSLIDAQWDSPFLRSLGARPMPLCRYLAELGTAARVALPGEPLPASRLLPGS